MADGSMPPPAPRTSRRSLTIRAERTTKAELVALRRANMAIEPYERPKTRGECAGAARPCAYLACKYHLAVDVTPAGSLQLNHPGLELEDMAETCALDVADRGGCSLEDVATTLGVSRERARQIEDKALLKLARSDAARRLRGEIDR